MSRLTGPNLAGWRIWKRRSVTQGNLRFEAEKFCRQPLRPFKDDAELLGVAKILFELRQKVNTEEDESVHNRLLSLECALASRFHKAVRMSAGDLKIVRAFRQYRLNRVEKEILLFLSLATLGMLAGVEDAEEMEVRDVQDALSIRARDRLVSLSLLTENSRLVKSGIVEIEGEESHINAMVRVSEDFITPLYREDAPLDGSWKVYKYEELLDKLYLIVSCLRERDDDIPYFRYAHLPGRRNPARAAKRELLRRMKILHNTLIRHPDWPLAKVLERLSEPNEKLVIIALIGKELGFVNAHSDLFTGSGLALAVSEDITQVRHNLKILRSDAQLRKQGYIQVCGGQDYDVAIEDDETLKACEFELTDNLLEELKIKRQRKSSQSARQPIVTMDRLVLHREVMQALLLAETQFKHADVMLKDWGLGETISYGSGVTLLFWGPPGTGKTSAAEALAHRLGKRIIVVNYAEVQNSWVGQTEKNIVRVFREAKEADAVLFWDEADAMFYDRSSASRNWEVRDVNILLQELERFNGICILSTNREVTLDKALERRIAIKVGFPKPDRDMRLQIWQKLIPGKMPLAPDVDLARLAEEELTGGEMKNVVLNAARFALCRGTGSKVTMADFKKAIEMEKSGKWTKCPMCIGFVQKKTF